MRKVNRRKFIKDAIASAVGLGLAPEVVTDAIAAKENQPSGFTDSSDSTQKKPNQPNIIFICCDQFRADVSRREGFALDTTPFMDSLARSGVWFDKAYCASPSCVPSRQAMWTGRWPTATGIKSNGNAKEYPDFKTGLFEVIKSQGYKTAAIGKMFHSYLGLHPERFDYFKMYGHLGWHGASDPQVKKFNAFLKSTEFYAHFKPAPFPATMQQPYRMVTDAQNWISSLKGQNSPFFMYFSMNEPHNPYQVSEPYYSLFPPDRLPPLKAGPETIQMKGKKYIQLKKLMMMAYPHLEQRLPRLRSIYYGMMRLIDDQVKRLVEFLKKQGLYENTIIFFVADHGDYAGEYGLMKKGAGMPECLTRIPMFWHGPGIIRQTKPHSACVSNTDIMPTICDLLGVPLPRGVQGRSLWPLLNGQKYSEEEFNSMLVMQGMGGLDWQSLNALDPYKLGLLNKKQPRFFDELNSWTQSGVLRMVRKGDWKLVYDMQGRGAMYHLSEDPGELHNLFGVAAHQNTQMELLQKMLAWELRTQDPLPLPERYVLKRDPRNYYAPYRSEKMFSVPWK